MAKIQILGSGFSRCDVLAKNALAAANQAGVVCEIEKVSNADKILQLGPPITPALAVDGEVKISGRIASVEEIMSLLR